MANYIAYLNVTTINGIWIVNDTHKCKAKRDSKGWLILFNSRWRRAKLKISPFTGIYTYYLSDDIIVQYVNQIIGDFEYAVCMEPDNES